jgi:hypothetical protein
MFVGQSVELDRIAQCTRKVFMSIGNYKKEKKTEREFLHESACKLQVCRFLDVV